MHTRQRRKMCPQALLLNMPPGIVETGSGLVVCWGLLQRAVSGYKHGRKLVSKVCNTLKGIEGHV